MTLTDEDSSGLDWTRFFNSNDGSGTFGGQGLNNEVTTRMIVPNGQTIFVGGLIKHRTEESQRGIPLISRIPGIGRLFSSRENNKTNTETIVLITPTILSDHAQLIDKDIIESIEQMEQRQTSDNNDLNNEMDTFFGR